MIERYILPVLFLLFCVSCDKQSESPEDDMAVKLFVEVGGKSQTKTVTETDGTVTFSGGDKLGMFVLPGNTPVMWSYQDSRWVSSESVKWENRTDDFEFLAYYPCDEVSGVTPDAVPMPDLSGQSGSLDDIGEKDFLVGRVVASYADNNGTVSFSGDNSLKHVYSLLYLSVVGDDLSNPLTITGCTFTGKGIVTPHTYSFDSASGGMIASGSPGGDVLTIEDLPSHDIAVLINPVSLDSSLSFTIRYIRSGQEYEAGASLGTDFSGGSFHKITLRLVDGKLIMTGNEVSDWNVITLDDIVLVGTSA